MPREAGFDAGDYDHAQRYASSVFFGSATPSADRLNLRIESILDACHEEHWDDFFDFEDADTYWQEHH